MTIEPTAPMPTPTRWSMATLALAATGFLVAGLLVAPAATTHGRPVIGCPAGWSTNDVPAQRFSGLIPGAVFAGGTLDAVGGGMPRRVPDAAGCHEAPIGDCAGHRG